MNKILLGFTTLLVAMTLSLCTPDPPEGPATVKKISIMGDSYSTFEGWSNRDIEGNPNMCIIHMKAIPIICEQVYEVVKEG